MPTTWTTSWPARARRGAPVVAIFELCDWLGRKGLQHLEPMNKGGSIDVAGLRVTMTDARHSSGYVDNGQMVYLGEAAGLRDRPRGRPLDLLRRRHRACSATCG